MSILIIVVFVVGYLAIALEHNIKIDKAASALITGMVCWAIYVFTIDGNGHDIQHVIEHGVEGISYRAGLVHHLFDIGSILFFLMGAMTIVELVDAHEGFAVITNRIKTTNAGKLLWIICILTFFLSAILDNLTTTIVMVSLLRKLIKDKQMRWLFVGMVVVAANAGGAWSPIGDVTTTMLWIKGQLPHVGKMVIDLIIPSLVAMIVPLTILSLRLKGQKLERPMKSEGIEHYIEPTTQRERILVFCLGLGGLLFVPIFKTVTHLPPFMGMMLSLGILWAVTEIIHRAKNKEDKHELSVIGVLQKIDVASVLFFLGILLAVSALQEFGHLNTLASSLNDKIGNIYAINVVIGFLSAIVDNVPLVAAAQGMYEIQPTGVFEAGGKFWEFLAYCAGVGGSSLIIGSAAGVAAMGLEKIDFIWYLKKISWLAVIGYLCGAATYFVIYA
ncbi:MAG: Na+/H+ antiporter NhaD/arsenite permease-like protein [Bacteroidia bacterium]|jgi:Na+/H+ antiporter NhaD/arsenite permease-like protein